MYERTVLDNGLRVISSTMPGTRSVTIIFFLGAGPIYEKDEEAGLSHFVEHLLFKGTQRRPTSKEISEAIEQLGGMFNGSTGKEATIYWFKVARPHFPIALDLAVDMLRSSCFHPGDMERERQVIMEELNESLDSPHHRVSMLIDEVVWPDQPMGRDVIGSRESVAGLTRDMLSNYLSQQYVPNNTVVSVAGDIGHQDVVTAIDRALADWANAVCRPAHPTDNSQVEPHVRVERKEAEQAHLCMAIRGLPVTHPDRFNLALLNVILGEGMSSRLFLEIREKRGLTYDIFSYVQHFLDSGALTVYAGVDPRHLHTTVDAIVEQLHLLKGDIPEAEVVKAKEYAKGRLLLRMEDTRNVASWTGGQDLLTGRIYTVDALVSIIDAITAEDLERVARELLVTESLNLAVVGPLEGDDGLRDRLKL
ncbi:MAG: M16 family metallopeptidase [Chloroflexota bacterium]